MDPTELQFVQKLHVQDKFEGQRICLLQALVGHRRGGSYSASMQQAVESPERGMDWGGKTNGWRDWEKLGQVSQGKG